MTLIEMTDDRDGFTLATVSYFLDPNEERRTVQVRVPSSGVRPQVRLYDVVDFKGLRSTKDGGMVADHMDHPGYSWVEIE